MAFYWDEFFECLKSGIVYIPNTLLLTIIPITIGIVLGGLIAIARLRKVPILSQFFAGFVAVYNGIPFMVTLLIYNLIFMLKFDDFAIALSIEARVSTVPSAYIGYFTLSLSAICILSEAIRGALLAVNKDQYEASYSVGLTVPQTLWRIVIPQTIPVAIPMFVNSFIGFLKNTSLVMTVGIVDILTGALRPCQKTYNFLVGYIAAALIYWVLFIIVERLAKRFKTNLSRYLNTI
jgi:L-cystine transport system permease protein